MKRFILLVLTIHVFYHLHTQDVPPPDTAGITWTIEGSKVNFKPVLKVLKPVVAGAPAPFYTYHWEFGDGDFSADANPTHVYTSPGTYTPYLCATNNYDDGKPPLPPKKPMLMDRGSAVAGDFKTILKDNRQSIALKANRAARQDEELVLILSYQNGSKYDTDGEIHLFYNEKVYEQRHFDFMEARTHYGETPVKTEVGAADPLDEEPWLQPRWASVFSPENAVEIINEDDFGAPIPNTYVDNARKQYRDENTWTFPVLKAGEKRNMFVSLQATPQMIRDTTALIHIKGVFVPGNAAVASEEFTLEIEIVSSHDPNAILVSDVRINYRLIKVKDIDYKVKFQNNGEGPAKKVEVSIIVPEGLNKSKMKPVDWYPKCPICPKEGTTKSCLEYVENDNGIVFTFRNIYLPGSNQKGVTEYDSTKGFVKYRIVPEKDMPKRSFQSQAKIVFDKNPPIYTNFSKTRFKKGFSPGPKIGFNYFSAAAIKNDPEFGPDTIKAPAGSYLFLGCTFSAYKPWTIFPQAELLIGRLGQSNLGEKVTENYVNDIDFKEVGAPPVLKYYKRDSLNRSTQSSTRNSTVVEIPVSIRKNVNRWLGVGAGGSAIMQFENITTNRTEEIRVTEYDGVLGPAGTIFWEARDPVVSQSSSSTDFHTVKTRIAAFADVNIGLVRAGPYLGFRAGYVFGDLSPKPFFQLSAGIKL